MTDSEISDAIHRAQSLTVEADEAFRQATYSALLGHFLARVGESPTRAMVTTNGGGSRAALPPSLGFNEFLAAKNVRTHVDRIVAIAYFAFRRGDESGITRKVIEEAYSQARLKKPQNIPDVVATCVRKGMLVDADRRDGMKAWLITQTGERHIEEL